MSAIYNQLPLKLDDSSRSGLGVTIEIEDPSELDDPSLLSGEQQIYERIESFEQAKEILAHLQKMHAHFSEVRHLLYMDRLSESRWRNTKGFKTYPERTLLSKAPLEAVKCRLEHIRESAAEGVFELRDDSTDSMLNDNVVRLSKLSRFLRVEVSKIREWATQGYIQLFVTEENEAEKMFWANNKMDHLLWDEDDLADSFWCTLRSARKVQLIEKYVHDGLKLPVAEARSEMIIEEEIRYDLRIYYYQLIDELAHDVSGDNIL